MNSTASSTRSLPFGTTTRSPPMNEADEPGSSRAGWRDAELELVALHLLVGERDVEVAGAHHAELAGAELQVERLAVLLAGAVRDVAGLDLVAGPLEDLP